MKSVLHLNETVVMLLVDVSNECITNRYPMQVVSMKATFAAHSAGYGSFLKSLLRGRRGRRAARRAAHMSAETQK